MNELIPSTSNLPPAFGGSLPTNLAELRSLIAKAKEAWLAKTESAKTRLAYGRDLDQFLEFLGFTPTDMEQMTRIVPDDVTGWRDHLLAAGGRPAKDGSTTPAENATVARKITSLRSFFSFLQSYGYRGANPAHPDFVKSPKVSDKGSTPAIEPHLVARLLEAPDPSQPVGVRDRAILAMFAFMALRVDELHLVNVGNITRDGEHNIVKIKGKGNDVRRGVLPPAAAAAVNAWIQAADIASDKSGPLFRPTKTAHGHGTDGFLRQRLTVRSIQRLLKKHCLAVGIPPEVSVHSLRVTAATQADRARIPLIDIQNWLGHKDPRTTLRYIRGAQHLDRSPAYTIHYG